MSEVVTIYFDGGSRGNPGPASSAAFTAAKGGLQKSLFMPHATNNEAEYRGLILAARLAKEQGFENVRFLGDSQLVVSQVLGEWKVKSPAMGELLAQVHAELKPLPRWTLQWIPRAENAEADRVANETMDEHMGIVAIPIATEEEREGVRPDISRVNALGSKVGFNDLRQLKVGGLDEFSKCNLEVLAELVPNFVVVQAAFHSRVIADPNTKTLDDTAKNKLVINALRWTARGLKGEFAIRKVLIDNETSMKMRDKRK
ncbi:MAG: ribonuclease HI family protein [Proteobacteria bacterium]|nr:MAG: ribonuclease HI family protein [Pseudomonadota bacterium]